MTDPAGELVVLEGGQDVEPRIVKVTDLLDPRSPRTSTDVRQERMVICKSCEHIGALHQCDICHCFMPLKTWLLEASCPLPEPKWPALAQEERPAGG